MQVTIISKSGKIMAREVNPAKKPNRHAFKYHYESRWGRFNSQLYKRDLSDWMTAESSLKEYEIENPFILVETSCLKFKGRKQSQTLTALSIGSIHSAELISDFTVRIID